MAHLLSLWIVGLATRLMDCTDPMFSIWARRAQSIWLLTASSQTAVIDQTMARDVNSVVHLILLVHGHILCKKDKQDNGSPQTTRSD